MPYSKLNNISGWVVFAISTFVYLSTIEPTASFWDCGEFIATAYKLEVGHPPGAPFFMILGRLFSAFVPVAYAATAINVLSALSSSFTILFLFWSITAFAKKLATTDGKTLTGGSTIAIIGSGLIGALCYTFSDSFWFSAVEGEVYAISSLFTAVVFWAILKWDAEEQTARSDRWIILIAYLMGLSIGVHLLNLLCIPAIALVMYLKNNDLNIKGLAITGILSLVVLGFIQSGIIPGIVSMAGGYELFFTENLNTGFNVGISIFSILVVALIVMLVKYAHEPSNGVRIAILVTLALTILPLLFNEFLGGSAKFFSLLLGAGLAFMVLRTKEPNRVLHVSVMSFAVILLGYSTFAMIVIRSSANPPMDENNPENVFTLLSYLNREQYGDRPLLKGHYWMAPTVGTEDGDPVYMKAYSIKDGKRTVKSFNNLYDAEQYAADNAGTSVEEEYIISDPRKNSVYEYDSRFEAIFPRMYSSQPNHVEAYKSWSDFKGKPTPVSDGQGGRLRVPTPGENMRFFTRYQVNHMYWRYFMWNFVGRQNDVQGHGGILDGNWLSGVDFIDEQRLGTQKDLPSAYERNKGRNKFFFLPLILGLIGLVYQLVKDTKNWLVIMLLFVLTGLAIVIYLNQYPYQPRERDYAYVGSFYAFAMWVGLGVYALYDAVHSLDKKNLMKILIAVVGTGGVIFLMESAGSGDHSFSYSILFMGLIGAGLMGLMSVLGKSLGEKNTAILATVLGLAVPLVMVADGWDDHNRAKRRTGVDIAKNYLESCEPNAIIFTNGDNDTFPLWYAQEVEGIRTDVRVVNLSLLNTDWYIDQMKRKAYESEAVPFTIDEPKYRQGTRDVVLVNPEQNGERMELKQALRVALDDSKTLPIRGMGNMAYLPTNKFYINVDTDELLRRGIVSPSDTTMMTGRIEWNIPGRYITKNNLMVLDLLANNDWSRPIYFAVTTGMDTYLNMQQYFKLTGMAYRVTPVKHPKSENPNKLGGVDTEKMYDNVMNKFQWGNMDTEELYMDENNLRLTTNIRLQLSNLAEELIAEGKDEMAHEVLDKTFEVMPENNVPITRVIMPLIESYAKVGDLEKAKELSQKLFTINEEELLYLSSLDGRFLRQLNEEMEIGMYVAQRMEYVARQYDMKDLQEEFKARTQTMRQAYDDAQERLKKDGRRSGQGVGF
jgi:MFS family permease